MKLGGNPLRDTQDRRLPQIAGPCGLVLFGVTGDLSRRKLIPSIYDLANRGLLPPGFALVGFARHDFGRRGFAEFAKQAAKDGARTEWRESVWKQLYAGVRFVEGSFDDDAAWKRLHETLGELDRTQGTQGNHAFYLSIPPGLFPLVVSKLKEHELAAPTEEHPGAWRRVVIEKPFGHDLASARELNRIVDEVFPPESVFRIDHYLGKETVQNVLAFRFANQLFEPVWNANYVDHVQITMAEDIGIGTRAGYYDGIGAARDVIQNHLLQLMALVAMEEPVSFDAKSLRIEKQKILANARPAPRLDLHTAHAQYVAGWAGGDTIRLGDPNPTGDNTLNMMALDISGCLLATTGAVFPQKGVFLGVYVSSSNGPAAVDFSGTGAGGTPTGGNALSNGTRNMTSCPIPTPVPSPISNSNLLFIREQLVGGSTDLITAYARLLGVYV